MGSESPMFVDLLFGFNSLGVGEHAGKLRENYDKGVQLGSRGNILEGTQKMFWRIVVGWLVFVESFARRLLRIKWANKQTKKRPKTD